MESCFFVEAKSIHYSVVNGLDELRVVEKRKGFSGSLLLGSRCAAWLFPLWKRCCVILFLRILLNLVGGSKVTIIQRGGNRFSWFLEVPVYVEGLRT